MNAVERYFSKITDILERILKNEGAHIEKAAEMLADAITGKKSVYAFGCSHGAILSEELFFRAGGLAVINPIFNPALMLNVRPVTLTSRFERMYGQSQALLEAFPIQEGDVMLIHSVSGRNPGIVEMAIEAKKKGMTVIGITGMEYSKASVSRHESGKRLFELTDLCIDNCGEFGDGCVSLPGVNEKAGASSTLAGVFIVNSISARAAEILLERGIKPPVLHSANADGGEAVNAKIFEEYKECIHYL